MLQTRAGLSTRIAASLTNSPPSSWKASRTQQPHKTHRLTRTASYAPPHTTPISDGPLYEGPMGAPGPAEKKPKNKR